MLVTEPNDENMERLTENVPYSFVVFLKGEE